jgi:hypothetical protein
MLISEDYRLQQRHLHKTTNYGVASLQYASLVADVLNSTSTIELLDYGAGRQNLIKAITERGLVNHEFTYIPYEPSDPECDTPPEPCDAVACIDVLEHIEPECLDAVLDDLKRVTRKIGIFTIATTPAVKVLPDGRNAHLIVEPPSWWMPKIASRFSIMAMQASSGGFFLIVGPLEE